MYGITLPRIPGAGHRLHRGEEKLLDAEFLVQRRQSDSGDGGRAIRVGDNRPPPAAFAALGLDQPEMIAIHFRNDEGDVGLHSEVLRVAQHELARLRERQLDLARNDRVECGKDDWRAHQTRVARDHAARHDRVRRGRALEPARDLAVSLPR
jgi:hypothetical protein